MANFLRHEPCSTCGSKDNLARYDDGSAWCFGGCLHYEPPDHSKRIANLVDENREIKGTSAKKWFDLPDDIDVIFPKIAMDWIGKSNVTIPLLRKNHVVWSERYQQLIYQFFSDMRLVGWQARNFSPTAKAKCFTSGDVNSIMPVYGTNGSRNVLYVVEDPLSAINVGQRWPCLPLLGSHIPLAKIHMITLLYDTVVIWLDNDKHKEAVAMSKRFEMVGIQASVLCTEHDPKYYSVPEMFRIAQGETL